MTGPTPKPPARTQTDQSLRAEREESDRAIAEMTLQAEGTADRVIQRARDKADGVLEHAREEADNKPCFVPGDAASIARERASEDDLVEEARDAADAALRAERQQARKILAGLLPLEREKTDRHLLTERTHADVALANRDDFLGMVSHDLRNLLSGVALEAEMLAEEHIAAVPRARRVQRYAARMNRLIGDLVDVVSIDAGKLSITRTRTELDDIIAQTIDAFAQSATRAGVTLTAACTQGLAADVDGERVMQVLANLVGNALKFTPRGGAISVRCGRGRGAFVRLTVKDSGPGIEHALHDAVFQRFWQQTDDQRGLGLGLYITRCIVEGHGGRITLESAPGEGAAFHVDLPVAHEQSGAVDHASTR